MSTFSGFVIATDRTKEDGQTDRQTNRQTELPCVADVQFCTKKESLVLFVIDMQHTDAWSLYTLLWNEYSIRR